MAHWLFAAFSTCVAFWYVSQSLAGLLEEPARSRFDRATAVLTVLLPQFAVHLFHSITPLEAPAAPGTGARLPKIAAALASPMLAVALSPFQNAPSAIRALALGGVYFYVFGLLAAALRSLWRRGEKSPSRAIRDRIRFLAAVGALAMTFTLADFVAILVVNLPPIGAVLAVVFLFVLASRSRASVSPTSTSSRGDCSSRRLSRSRSPASSTCSSRTSGSSARCT
jgi:hypothetical protein